MAFLYQQIYVNQYEVLLPSHIYSLTLKINHSSKYFGSILQNLIKSADNVNNLKQNSHNNILNFKIKYKIVNLLNFY